MHNTPIPHRFSRFVSLSLGLSLLCPVAAFSQATYTWSGQGGTGNWSDSGNWTSGNAPTGMLGSAEDIVLGLPSATAPIADSVTPWYLNTLSFAANAGNVNLTGNTLTFTVNNLTVINANIAGTFTHRIENNLNLANWNAIRSGASAGGNLIVTGNVTAGLASNVVTFRGLGNDSIMSGLISGPAGATLNAVTKTDAGTWTFSNSGNRIGTFNLAGGRAKLGADNALGNGVVLRIGNTSSVGNGIVDLNGHNQRVGGLAGIANNNIYNREIVTNSSNTTASTLIYERSSDNETFAGQLTGNLSFVKRGTNTFTLTADGIHANSGENTLTGSIGIEEGTLALDGNAHINSVSAITVADGATFDVSTRTGGFVLGAGQRLGGGGTVLNTGKTLTVSGTLESDDILNISGGELLLTQTSQIALMLGNTSSQINLTDGAVLNLGNGIFGVSDFVFVVDGGFSVGEYLLIDGAASVVGTLNANDLSGVINGYQVMLSAHADSLRLTVAVPESGTVALVIALAGFGTACLLRRRQRRAACLRS